jgi:DNA polymerase III epsilon subunit-like protein
MKTTFAKILVAVMIVTVAGAYSCKNRGESKKQKDIDAVELEALEQKIEENVYPLPTSAEVIKKLTEMDLGYILGATNPPSNYRNYVESYKRSVNLGIYGGDLSYATLYNMNQDVIDYLSAIRELTLEQNLSQIYDESLYDEIKEYFDNRDTLVTILTDAFDHTYSIMVDAGQENLALLMVGGAWVEGMYLTLAVSESGAHLSGFESVLLEQKKSFELYEELAQPLSEDPLVSRMLTSLQPIRDVYAELKTSLTMEEIETLKKAVNSVRAKLVE